MRNFCICEKKAWKKFRLVRDSNPWPLRYRCSALLPIKLTTEANWEEVIESVRYSPMKGWWWSYEYEMGALHVFNLAKTLVLIPHKKQKMPSEKGQVPEGWRSSSWGSNQIWTSLDEQTIPHWFTQSFTAIIDRYSFYSLVKIIRVG